MPELPEVETVRKGLVPAMENRTIESVTLNRPDLRYPFPEQFAERVKATRIVELGRRAKFLTAHLDSGETVILHLGMSGRFTVDGGGIGEFAHSTGGNPKHDHVVFHLERGITVTYNDPRRFGFIDLATTAELDSCRHLSGLGPEPLTDAFDAAHLNQALTSRKSPIKTALLDQRIVAGLGNIYVCEALFRSGISPRRLANTIPGVRAKRLAPIVDAVIAEAIESGGSSISDFAATDGALGYFQHSFRVYGREGEPCPNCDRPIKRIVQSNRSTFFCSACQK